MRPFSLEEIAGVAGASLAGPGDLVFKGVAPLSDAGPEDLSFVAGLRNARDARASRAGALIVPSLDLAGGRPALLHPRPAVAMAIVLEHLVPEPAILAGVSDRASVSESAKIGAGASVAPGAFVGARASIGERVLVGPGVFVGDDAVVGDDCRILAGAVIERGCRVGARCRIGPGAVVGADGFGYAWDGSRHRRIPQVGIAVLEDDVDVGANACIDRAALTETRVGRGTKIDNLVQIGHNVTIGEHSIVCGQVGIAGSARIGKRVTLAGQVGVGDRMEIGDGATASAQAGVMRRVEAGSIVSGMPAEPHADFLRREAAADRLPELFDRVRALEEKVAGLSRKD
ncbi:MAG: UDP-3-O-(3-hydroxymyristoyl)glucosamine N-acyltransferase [Thermoanaerobaculia bacterium]